MGLEWLMANKTEALGMKRPAALGAGQGAGGDGRLLRGGRPREAGRPAVACRRLRARPRAVLHRAVRCCGSSSGQ